MFVDFVNLHGLKEAPHAWFQKFWSAILKHGFNQNNYDQSLFPPSRVLQLIIISFVNTMKMKPGQSHKSYRRRRRRRHQSAVPTILGSATRILFLYPDLT